MSVSQHCVSIQMSGHSDPSHLLLPGILSFASHPASGFTSSLSQHPQIPEKGQDSFSMLARKRWAHHSSRSMGTKSEKEKELIIYATQVYRACGRMKYGKKTLVATTMVHRHTREHILWSFFVNIFIFIALVVFLLAQKKLQSGFTMDL